MNKESEPVADEGAQVLCSEASERMKEKRENWNEKYEEFKTGGRKKMSNFNRVVMMGRLTRDPELKKIASGRAVAELGLAVSETHKNKSGEFVEKTCFIDIVAWGRQAETCAEYLKKGSPVLVEGKLQLDQWVSKEGQKRSKHLIQADRVQFLSSGKKKAEDGKETVPAKSDAGASPLPF